MTLASPRPPVLDFCDLGKSYGHTRALEHISFAVKKGEMVGLLGPNGAGKSTLFQLAAGLFAPDTGKVELFGRSYKNDASFILSRLGVVFQSRSLDLDMSVRANLKFHGGLFGLSGRLLKSRLAKVADIMDIEELLDKTVRTLSGGNQRRVEIARALLSEPKLLLLDEPSVGLDAAARRKLVAHMRAVGAREGTAILWATHLVDEVEAADRIVVLRQGQVIAEGTPAQLTAESGQRDLTSAYIALTGAPEEEVPEAPLLPD